jgi:hypothetical protein
MPNKSKVGSVEKGINFPFLTACSLNLFHTPWYAGRYGTTPENILKQDPESINKLRNSLRSFQDVCSYPPNQAFIGNIDPHNLPGRPWSQKNEIPAETEGPFGDIITEKFLYGLIKFADVFDLVALEKSFSGKCLELFEGNSVTDKWDLSSLEKGESIELIRSEIKNGALPLENNGILVGYIKGAHPDDENLQAHTILENLSSKATAVYAVQNLLVKEGIDPGTIDYIIETSEEACGDMNQRGGGNFAKSIGELTGLINATGSDTRSFCAGPIHGVVQAASLVKAGTFNKVIVVAGGATAKLAMNAIKHIEKGLPVLEDCMGAFALIIEKENSGDNGIILRTDAVGIHKIGSGAAPKAVITDLVSSPVYKAGYRLSDIDYYAPELQNPEITENAGAGNVTEANLKMIAALAVMNKEIDRADIPDFIKTHGSSGWAPTQGHIPSGIPAFPWLIKWAAAGSISRALVIGKGSLFLGRMTGLFDGISILIEGTVKKQIPVSSGLTKKTERIVQEGKTLIGLTLPGSEGGVEELKKGAILAMKSDPDLEVIFFGTEDSDSSEAHKEMEKGLAEKQIAGAVTFHYPFPIGVATVGHFKAPGNGRNLFVSTTTGVSSTSRIEALVKNAIYGVVAAKAWGVENPEIGFLNLDGAGTARKIFLRMIDNGYRCKVSGSSRGDDLLRGNDILTGSVDVAVCDSLTGNIITKLMGSYSSSGAIEENGSGYGPGIGDFNSRICIISRASAATVVKDAILFTRRISDVDLKTLYDQEISLAETSGLKKIITEYTGKPSNSGLKAKEGTGRKVPKRKVVNKEIEGVDVLNLDDAVLLLQDNGVYCEAGMGCTGPVIMVSEEDQNKSEEILKQKRFI